MTNVLERLEAAIAASPIPVFAYWQGAELFFVSIETVEGRVRHYASSPEVAQVQVDPVAAVQRHASAAADHWIAEGKVRTGLAVIEALARRDQDRAHGGKG